MAQSQTIARQPSGGELKGEGRPTDVRPPEEKWTPETAKLSSPVQGEDNRMSSGLGKIYCPDAG